MTYTLYSVKRWGSVVIEAMLELLGIEYENVRIEYKDETSLAPIARYNPLKQVPTLVRSDGLVMTESAAIVLWLVHEHAQSPLALPRDPVARAAMHRWIVFLAVNVYGSIIMGDFPERWAEGEVAQTAIKTGAPLRARECWMMFEQCVAPAPYLLGAEMSALDVYATLMGRWVGKEWREQNCPKTSAAIALTEKHPVIAKVWARNFG